MLLKNYYKGISGHILGGNFDQSISSETINNKFYITSPDASTHYLSQTDIFNRINISGVVPTLVDFHSENPYTLVLSSDETAVTYEDYTMNDLVYDADGLRVGLGSLSLTRLSSSKVIEIDDNTYQYSTKVSIGNTNSKSFTIKKWGIVVRADSAYNDNMALIFADVLDAPFQVGAYESFTMTLTVNVNPARPF